MYGKGYTAFTALDCAVGCNCYVSFNIIKSGCGCGGKNLALKSIVDVTVAFRIDQPDAHIFDLTPTVTSPHYFKRMEQHL